MTTKCSAHSLIVVSCVHHMISRIFISKKGHQDEVSYYEVFLIDSILTRERINLGFIILLHLVACCESKSKVLTYGRFFTKVFKKFGVYYLTRERERDIQVPFIYDTYKAKVHVSYVL